MKSKLLMWTCIIFAAALFGYNQITKHGYDPTVRHKIEEALKSPDPGRETRFGKSNYVQILGSTLRFTENQIQKYLKGLGIKERAGVRFWSRQKHDVVAASAFGTDHSHHFVSGYLVGYEPFKTRYLWMPHYTVSMRLRYQLDSKQYGGLKDVWQTSKQAFHNTRGDCEDHALILVDWLIEMGADARVVLGAYKKQGHAWIVVFKDSNVYLLEATAKQKRKHWRHYPLARLEPDYHPKFMFDRDYFWVNTGTVFTTDYQGKHWVKKSRYVAAEQIGTGRS
jgi:hypothetical protein